MIERQVGPYRLVAEIGSGAMGAVYAARDADGNRVAVKLIHPHLAADAQVALRFAREAEAGRAVHHENVVSTIAASSGEDGGVPYLAMEFVEGRTLAELRDELGPVPEELVREIVRQSAAGLAAIHGAGIVHRDVKPQNILITHAHDVRIMDLGVAKLVEATVALTQEGQFAGSLAYAAPEQFRGEPVGPAADLYSLGVLLLELVLGENPFCRDTPAATIRAHLESRPPRSPGSAFLADLIGALLDKQAEGRPSALDVVEILKQGEGSAWWRGRRRTRATPRPVRIAVARPTRVVGRATDWKRLQAAWQRAVGATGAAVWLAGETGIGKSRLVADLIEGAENAHVLYGAYELGGGSGFRASLATRFDDDQLETELARWLPDAPDLVAPFAAFLLEQAPQSPLSAPARQSIAVRLLHALAADHPLLWILEDLHFAPPEDVELFLALARAVSGHRALVVATARPEDVEPDAETRARIPILESVTLARLGPRDVVDLLEEAFGSEGLAEDLGGKVARKSDGVPLFVLEMVRALIDGGHVQRTADGTYAQTGPISVIDVPASVTELVAGRLLGLSDEDRDLLDAAAVQGAAFDSALLAAVVERKRIAVLRRLAALERRTGLVHASASGYRFDQHQVREIVYSELPDELRRECHTLTADAYAANLVGEPRPEDQRFLAWHHLRGREPARGLPYTPQALDLLESSYRNDEFLDLAEQALPHLAGDDRGRLLLRRAKRLDHVGRREEALAILQQAHREGTGTQGGGGADDGDVFGDELRAEILHGLGVVLGSAKDPAEAQARLEEARDLARRAGAPVAEANALLGLYGLADRRGDHGQARSLAKEAVAIAQKAGAREIEARATGELGVTYARVRDLTRAREAYTRALSLWDSLGRADGGVITRMNLGGLHERAGEIAQARACLQESVEQARRFGNRYQEAHATGNLAVSYCWVGRFEEARRLLARYEVLLREIGEERDFVWHRITCGLLHRIEHEHDAAADDFRAAASAAAEAGMRPVEALAQSSLGHVLATTGRHEEAGAACDRAEALGNELGLADVLEYVRVQRGMLPGGDVADAAAVLAAPDSRLSRPGLLFGWYWLWKHAGDEKYRDRALAMLRRARDHAPEEDRDHMLQAVPAYAELWSS